ncbi:hypothetical protein [Rhizobium sp. L1K21]|uniref:hypothetical protein n=1 Tax=Rhizobium sp. L1K21 TaxID=2954933 RepID=UPI0020930086|nr:hypothetical protein [Rhizobium sp. L1K21]MCO6187770.1 hypothetical protein [Rhizobium sp. L1K21]
MAAITLVAAAASYQPAHADEPIRLPAGQVVTDIAQNSMSAEEILQEDAITSVRVVTLADFEGARLQDLQDTLGNAEDNFAEVRSAIVRNEAWEKKLLERGVSIDDVRAVTRDPTGAVTFYVHMPSP